MNRIESSESVGFSPKWIERVSPEQLIAHWIQDKSPLSRDCDEDGRRFRCPLHDALSWLSAPYSWFLQTHRDLQDQALAYALGISRFQTSMLNEVSPNVNELADVLLRPERLLGKNAPLVLRFYQILQGIPPEQWKQIQRSFKAIGIYSGEEARFFTDEFNQAANIARDAVKAVLGDFPKLSVDSSIRRAPICWINPLTRLGIIYATYEIQGHDVLRRQHTAPFFLPIFPNPENGSRPLTMRWLRQHPFIVGKEEPDWSDWENKEKLLRQRDYLWSHEADEDMIVANYVGL